MTFVQQQENEPVELPGRTFIARHGETVFNRAARLQGQALHTPLTRAGFLQADAMGLALLALLGEAPPLRLWSSDAGRALQTLAIIVERLGLDWHAARTDRRLTEIGMGSWGGRYYGEVVAEHGPIVVDRRGLLRPAPDGETYPEIAARVAAWARDAAADGGDRLVIMHGISSRVLRGVLLGLPPLPDYGAPVADGLPQGSIVCIEDGREAVVHLGGGGAVA